MDYPLIINGQTRGKLSISQEGLYTLIEGEADAAEEITRLWLCSGGEAGYLGIMQRRGDKMYISRRCSRHEMAAFPENIEYAADAPVQKETEKETEREKEKEEPQKPEPTENDIIWYRSGNGCLTAQEGEYRLLALPSKIGKSVPGTDIRIIEGSEYIIFRY